jgi:hypothetical protein
MVQEVVEQQNRIVSNSLFTLLSTYNKKDSLLLGTHGPALLQYDTFHEAASTSKQNTRAIRKVISVYFKQLM